ncbi:jg1236 [Pararge aegeria aegeria]|uniref:Jg1236 protein n=1 Tax=Pararge aegeria aegeria TaxID=348720 RepID=A0A8S4QRZ1_9NEOP|nr:jg1236 [Pararge aegeria aegeria]
MWTFRRMLAIYWTREVPNEEVLRRVNQRRELMHTIKIRSESCISGERAKAREICAPSIYYDGKSCKKKRRWSQKKVLASLHQIVDWNRECSGITSSREKQTRIYEVDCQPSLFGEAPQEKEELKHFFFQFF